MKKSLLAVAAIGAFASAAQAQSSVTVYGILDVGFTGKSATAPATGVKTNTTQFNGGGNESTSRLGFKGNEDLGGGMSAFFTSEFQLYGTDYHLSGNSNTGLLNRQTFVGLKKNGIGEAAIGTQYTPIHVSMARNSAAGQNNVYGDIIYAPTNTQGADFNSAAYTVRQNNALTASTAKLAGFTVSGMYVNNNQSTSATTPSTAVTTANQQGYGIGINYGWQKLNVDAVYQSFKSENATVAGKTAAALPSGSNINGTSLTDSQAYAGATYDFGILKAYAQWINRKATSGVNSNVYVKRSAQQIGVRSFITPTVEAWGALGNGRYTAFSAGAPTANMSAWQVGSNYWLSKRTNLYAIYGNTKTNSTSAAQFAGQGSQYAVGVRHTF
jgi:predicted porin